MPEPTNAPPAGAPNPAPVDPNAAGAPAGTPTPAPTPAGTPTPAPAPALNGGNILGDPNTSPPANTDDWATRRTAYANGDQKLLARLSRYSSEKDVVDALIAAQNKISSGGLKAPLPDNATPEELKAWRTENGIPEDVNGYQIRLPEGYTKESLGDFLTAAHNANLTPAQVEQVVGWKADADLKAANARQEADENARLSGIDALRTEWGSEFGMNVNLITSLLDGAPQGVKEGIMSARLADGTPLASHPTTLRWLAHLAREMNPTATVVPGHGASAIQAIESELATLNKMMGDPSSEYWKGPKAETNQARWRELFSVQQKVSNK